MDNFYNYIPQRTASGPIPLRFMTKCGILHYVREGIVLTSETAEDCGAAYRLPAGMPIAADINGITYSGCLDFKYSQGGQLGWTIAGTNLWDWNLDGLSVRVPVYVRIERDDGEIYDLENPGNPYAADSNAGLHSYRYSDMDIRQAVSMHINSIIGLINECDGCVLGEYIDCLLDNAPSINMDTLEMVRESSINSRLNGLGASLINYWVEGELKHALGYPVNSLNIESGICRDTGTGIYGGGNPFYEEDGDGYDVC